MDLSILDEKQVFENLNSQKNPFFAHYYAFYSSWFGGVIKNPRMMLLPIDDHMVHRGDGVFEALKAIDGKAYLLDEHLTRLMISAAKISLTPKFSVGEMKEIILQTLKIAGQKNALVRIYLSRGPGSFSPNPYDSVGSQFYVVITELKSTAAEKYQQGVKAARSHVPAKESWMATVKSCNYLPNVMMKKEAVDRKLEFVIGFDEYDFVAEGPTENIVIVDAEGVLTHPELEFILKGTTMTRACELARDIGMKTAARAISNDDLKNAREVMMMGTTLDVLPVVEFDGKPIANGKVGAIAKKLHELILQDMKTGTKLTSF
jgi:branched-chain amino acid aminotransferase